LGDDAIRRRYDMFKFSKEQQIFEIDRVKVGGQPGQLPTVLVGSIFYSGHRIVTDPRHGQFDRQQAEELLDQEEAMSQQTGNPRIIDVNAEFAEAMLRYVDFVAEKTDAPFLIDSPVAEVSLAALRHVEEVGLANRAIFNSINPGTKPEELRAISEAGLEAAIVLTFNSRRPTIDGRMAILEGRETGKSLLALAREAGITKTLVDVSVLDVPDPGPVSRAIYMVKERYGLPAGGGLHNAIGMWRNYKELDQPTSLIASSVANAMPIALGADFLLYGPMRNATTVFTACALADAYVAYAMRQQYRMSPLTREHPLYKIFKP
jgi:tetrahydromethanopterin S-methyltransferase subunit H